MHLNGAYLVVGFYFLPIISCMLKMIELSLILCNLFIDFCVFFLSSAVFMACIRFVEMFTVHIRFNDNIQWSRISDIVLFFALFSHLHKIIIFKLTLKQCFEKSIAPSDWIHFHWNTRSTVKQYIFCGYMVTLLLNSVLDVKIHFHQMLKCVFSSSIYFKKPFIKHRVYRLWWTALRFTADLCESFDFRFTTRFKLIYSIAMAFYVEFLSFGAVIYWY